jgi:hexosaminidase
MDVSFVKRYIDLLSFLKMNVLHWHLVDDQGWRIEIKKYPKLTEIGAYREGYGGFYSQEEVREIVAYSKTKFVQIIPEIEMPGHCVSSLASYPHLSCFPDQKYKVETEWGIFKDVYCAGNESTFEFLEDVLKEVMELFDGPLIHLGGDECPKENWKKCVSCQKRIIEEKLKNEDELQHYFMKRMCLFLQKYNKTVIGWDEILEGGETLSFSENVIVQSWRGMSGALEASQKKISSIVSPTSHCYFDYGLDAIDLKKVYSFNPIPNEEMIDFVLGGECNMWSERAPQELVDSKVFPRILAMSEVLWSKAEKNYKNFHDRVERFYKILDKLVVEYGDESVPIQMEVSSTIEDNELLSTVKLIPGGKFFELFYSLAIKHGLNMKRNSRKQENFFLM